MNSSVSGNRLVVKDVSTLALWTIHDWRPWLVCHEAANGLAWRQAPA